MRYIKIAILLCSTPLLFGLSSQELANYRTHLAERLFKEIPGIVTNLKQRDDRLDIPTNKEVHFAFADTVIANLLPSQELQILLDLPQFKNIAQRKEIFGNQPESVRLFLETIVNWLSQLDELRFEGKQYLSNFISEFVKLAPYAQEVITDPDDWQTFVNQLIRYRNIIRSSQFLKEHQDLKPSDIEFALSLLKAKPTADLGMQTQRLQHYKAN